MLLALVVFGVGLWLAGLAATTVRDSGVGQADTLALAFGLGSREIAAEQVHTWRDRG